MPTQYNQDQQLLEPPRCKYSSKYCPNICAQKRPGHYLTLCQEHRDEANRRQRVYDKKKRLEPYTTPQELYDSDIEALLKLDFDC